jgi:Low-density lipoprotein receptor repeat class B.
MKSIRMVVLLVTMWINLGAPEVSPAQDASKDGSPEWIYWTDSINGRIRRARLDGSNVEDVAWIDDQGDPVGVAIDPVRGKVYGNFLHSLAWADLDGSELDFLYLLDVGSGIAIDPVGQVVFFASDSGNCDDYSGCGIYRVNTDGTGMSQVVSLSYPVRGLALDTENDKIYWTAWNQGIKRANTDGSAIEPIISRGVARFPAQITAVPGKDRIYWTNRDSHFSGVYRADLNGDNIVHLSTGWAEGVAVDPQAGKFTGPSF